MEIPYVLFLSRSSLLVTDFLPLIVPHFVEIAAFAARGYRVICPSQMGYGDSDKPSDLKNYGYKSVAYDMNSLLNEVGCDGRVIVLGHDWYALLYSISIHLCTTANIEKSLQGRNGSLEIRRLLPSSSYRYCECLYSLHASRSTFDTLAQPRRTRFAEDAKLWISTRVFRSILRRKTFELTLSLRIDSSLNNKKLEPSWTKSHLSFLQVCSIRNGNRRRRHLVSPSRRE